MKSKLEKKLTENSGKIRNLVGGGWLKTQHEGTPREKHQRQGPHWGNLPVLVTFPFPSDDQAERCWRDGATTQGPQRGPRSPRCTTSGRGDQKWPWTKGKAWKTCLPRPWHWEDQRKRELTPPKISSAPAGSHEVCDPNSHNLRTYFLMIS